VQAATSCTTCGSFVSQRPTTTSPTLQRPTSSFGVATQFFGATPACNISAPECTDPVAGKPVCCTGSCEVLGVGTPTFAPLDAANLGAGVQLTYISTPASPSDPFVCPFNPATGMPFTRSINLQLVCDPAAVSTFVVGVAEVSACNYTATFNTSATCLP